MNLDETELKAHVADRRITAITVDTSVFDRFQNGLEHGTLAQLGQFKDSDVRVLLSDVVAREVRAHLVRDAAAAQAALKTSLKTMGGAWNLAREVREELIAQATGAETPEQMADRRLSAFLEQIGAEVVKSEGRVDVGRLLDAYFSSAAPFGTTEAKKSEFPDAIALQALEHWAADNETQVLAVAMDSDWLKYCDASTRLACVDELAKALETFHQDASIARARIANGIERGELDIDDALQDAIHRTVDRIAFLAEADSSFRFEAEVTDISVDAVRLVPEEGTERPDLTIVDSDADSIVLEAIAVATLEVTASFSFSATDPIDGDEMRIGACSASQEVDLDARVLLTFDVSDQTNPELFEVEASVERGSNWLHFGSVEPNWGHGDE